jgi:cytochrome c oxidase cbb3-type subunit I
MATAETAYVLRGRFAGIDLDELVDWRVVRTWLYWGMFWLMVTPSVGVTLSGIFNYPDYLGGALGLTFGRLRPVHVNGVIFGAFSALFIGECYYLVPRLCGVRLVYGEWGVLLAWVWNLAVLAGLASLPLGWNHGLEAGELPLFAEIPLFIVTAAATAQFIATIAQRLEPPLYVALWYLIAAFVWTTMNLVLGSFILPYTISGINSAAFHGLYIHYIVGLWITPAGYVLIYYFLPLSVRNPLYAHKLSLVGFWSLALFYPFVGIHHYLFSPIADWAETLAIITSMLLIIPVWTVLVNFFGTVAGRWEGFGRNLPAKFLIMGALMYLFGCFQGSVEALRSIQQPTHFSDFVISHSHLTVFGTFVVWAMGGLVYVWPRLCGRELWSFTMGNWSFWLITVGISTMGLVLTAGGLQQGFEWMNGTEWVDTVIRMRPYWLVRTLAGITMDTGMSLLVINMMMTRIAQPAEAVRPVPPAAAPLPAAGPAQWTPALSPWWLASASFFSRS